LQAGMNRLSASGAGGFRRNLVEALHGVPALLADDREVFFDAGASSSRGPRRGGRAGFERSPGPRPRFSARVHVTPVAVFSVVRHARHCNV
jgi:hypothetical protein